MKTTTKPNQTGLWFGKEISVHSKTAGPSQGEQPLCSGSTPWDPENSTGLVGDWDQHWLELVGTAYLVGHPALLSLPRETVSTFCTPNSPYSSLLETDHKNRNENSHKTPFFVSLDTTWVTAADHGVLLPPAYQSFAWPGFLAWNSHIPIVTSSYINPTTCYWQNHHTGCFLNVCILKQCLFLYIKNKECNYVASKRLFLIIPMV